MVPPGEGIQKRIGPSLTIQATVVVLPVCAHSVFFTNKHNFGHAHFDQPCPLQGTTYTEQFLLTKEVERSEEGTMVQYTDTGHLTCENHSQLCLPQ